MIRFFSTAFLLWSSLVLATDHFEIKEKWWLGENATKYRERALGDEAWWLTHCEEWPISNIPFPLFYTLRTGESQEYWLNRIRAKN